MGLYTIIVTLLFDLEFYQEQWLQHVYDGWPRGVTIMPELKRATCRNEENYIMLLMQGFYDHDCYADVYPETHLTDTGVIANKIFMDFDSIDKKATYEEVLAICRLFKSVYDYTPRVYFSGNKGFHIFIDFDDVAVDPYAIHLYVEGIADLLKLKTIDWHVIGDKRRISRLPYTMNTKSGLWCIPVQVGTPLEDILKQAKEPALNQVVVEKCDGIDDILSELNEKVLAQKQSLDNIAAIPITSGEKRHLQYMTDISELFFKADKYEGGRHRTLFAYLIPRLVYVFSEGHYQDLSPQLQEEIDVKVLSAVQAWVERTPTSDPDEGSRKPLENYLTYTKRCLRRLRTQGWQGWQKETFWEKFPDLAKYWYE